MSDEIDLAQEREAEFLADALENQARRLTRARAQITRRNCHDCGEPIPAARRRALPGVQLCIDCAAREEHYKGRR